MPAFSQQAGGTLTDRQIELLVSGMRASWSKPEGFKGVEIPAYSASETVPYKASAGSIVNTSASGDAPSGARAYQTFCAQCHGPNGEGGSAGSIVDPNFLNLVSDQGLRTTVVVGRADMASTPAFKMDRDRLTLALLLGLRSFPLVGQPELHGHAGDRLLRSRNHC